MQTADRKLGSRVYLKSQCNQCGPWIGINGQLTVCFSKLLVFIQYIISVSCKQPSEFLFRRV